MSIRHRLTAAAVILGVALASPAWAGTPTGAIAATPLDLSFTSPGVNVHSATQTFTLNFLGNAQSTFETPLAALAFQGTNATDFAIVGGTCVPGTTVLDGSVNSSCTVVVQYTPSSSGAEAAQLFASCTTVGLPGGTAVNCDGTSQFLGATSGSLLAVLIGQAPALDSRVLTLLASLLIGTGAYFATRKQA